MLELSRQEELEIFKECQNYKGRYTDFPTRRLWSNHNNEKALEGESLKQWQSSIFQEANQLTEVDFYWHIPFCQALCSFCGLNIKVTKETSLARPFLHSLLTEAQHYHQILGPKSCSNLYIAGGTPNYLKAQDLGWALEQFFQIFAPSDAFTPVIELDVRYLDDNWVAMLGDYQFKRVHLGVQDLSPQVLSLANRYHPEINIQKNIERLLSLKGLEVYVDLIYGLPGQSVKSFLETSKQISAMGVHGLSLYPLITPPWNPHLQSQVLDFESKTIAYLEARNFLRQNHFTHLGQGHFARNSSALTKSFLNKSLRRNLSAFFEKKSPLLIPLGPGAQGYGTHYLWANTKITELYQNSITKKKLSISALHPLNAKEIDWRQKFERLLGQHHLPQPLPADFVTWAQSKKLIDFKDGKIILSAYGLDHLGALADRWLASTES